MKVNRTSIFSSCDFFQEKVKTKLSNEDTFYIITKNFIQYDVTK
jgi:hypothetical protein